MVHIEMAAAVESFSSTEMLDSISTDFSGLISCHGVRFSISIKMQLKNLIRIDSVSTKVKLEIRTGFLWIEGLSPQKVVDHLFSS